MATPTETSVVLGRSIYERSASAPPGFPIQHTRLAWLLRGAVVSRGPDFSGGNRSGWSARIRPRRRQRDSPPQTPRDAEGQRQGRVILTVFDRYHRLARMLLSLKQVSGICGGHVGETALDVCSRGVLVRVTPPGIPA